MKEGNLFFAVLETNNRKIKIIEIKTNDFLQNFDHYPNLE